MKYFFLILSIGLLCAALSAQAGSQAGMRQDHEKIFEQVLTFVRDQTRALPGQVTIKVDAIDKRIERSACAAMETFLPPGTQLMGNGMVGVRCPGKNGWTLFVPVRITVKVDMLIANKPLAQGRVITPDDLSTQNGELLQTGILTDPAQAIGKVLKFGVNSGQILRQDMLRPPYVIVQGQKVVLQVEGSGFSVRSEAQALNNAAEGQNTQVKTHSGKVLNGIARSGGIVEVPP